MFEKEQQLIEEKIKTYCDANGIALAPLKWTAIPFAGEWGIATSFFQTAADEARVLSARPAVQLRDEQSAERRDDQKRKPVPARAQEMAEQVKGQIGSVDGISRVDAVKGYLNVYYRTSEYAQRVVDEVLASRRRLWAGRGKNASESWWNMPSQTRIHSFTLVMRAIQSSVKCWRGWWNLQALKLSALRTPATGTRRHHRDVDLRKVLQGTGTCKACMSADNGWRNLYVEATALLEKKENETPEETAQREGYEAERREMYRKWDAGDASVRELWRVTREWSLEELRDVLRMLDVKMDVWFYESRSGRAIQSHR
jgi:arginyl-tRNA synthetase